MNKAVFLMIAVIACAVTRLATADDAPKSESFRRIPIPKREHGYGSSKSMVIHTQAELDAYLKTIQAQNAWNNRKGFVDAITNAKVDFAKEALVLLFHTEGSGSVQITFKKPVIKSKSLMCTVTRKAPETGTADMAYYCFALAVSKTDVSTVTLAVKGKKTVALAVGKK